MTQEKILKENTIRNAHQVTFPNKPIVSAECKVYIYIYIYLYILGISEEMSGIRTT